jgi:tetratricopeptide (TPR) repeat protein
LPIDFFFVPFADDFSFPRLRAPGRAVILPIDENRVAAAKGIEMSSKEKHSSDKSTSTSIGSAPIRSAEKLSQLDFELDFFEGILQRNPDFVDALRVHGNNLTLKGRYAEGLKIDRRIVELRPKDALAHYNLACSLSLLKKVDQALRALRKAIELGYHDFRYLREDRDLDAIRKDPRFRQLLREFENR